MELKRTSDILPPTPELLRMAEVASNSVQAAAEAWKTKPPDATFADILDAEIE